MKKPYRPIIGITLGDPVGIGPEIICRALEHPSVFEKMRPLVIGDVHILKKAAGIVNTSAVAVKIDTPANGAYVHGIIDVMDHSGLDDEPVQWGVPTIKTGRAMIDYINQAVDLAMAGEIDAIATCPINKAAMKLAGSRFHGHTELLAARTQTPVYAMMMAGKRLRVVLVTIHMPLKDVSRNLSAEKIETVISLTDESLKSRFGIVRPKIGVAGFNPHAGEEDMFGSEESEIIRPAVLNAAGRGIQVFGPSPPDTLFYHAASGACDAVVCMYHDQGLIPFKMIHFTDGVNTTLGLPIIRTSVDHGTAYDIAGQGKADPGSLIAALEMAAEQAVCLRTARPGKNAADI
jgi:4-phospho-D-threonate 3-dehydrogenase / 4-phospho-D-erythronate 3-dehydrogenase